VRFPATLGRLPRPAVVALAVVVVILLATGVGVIAGDDPARVEDSEDRRATGAGPRRGGPTSTTSTSGSTTTSPGPDTGSTTLPGPDIEPASPPVTLPPGAQGPVRPEPCDATGPPANPLPFRDGPSGGGRSWVTVARLDGNCGGASSAFGVRGVDTRLLFRSDAEQFLVFLDDLVDVDAAAGYADVECRTPCADEQILTIGQGRYRLRVAATDAPWEVLLQEYR
jgi:hypothetical protein